MATWVDQYNDGAWAILEGEHEADIGTVAVVYDKASAQRFAAAKEMVEALRLFAEKTLWEDLYEEGTPEYAEAAASDAVQEMWIKPSWVRAARAALAKAGEKVKL